MKTIATSLALLCLPLSVTAATAESIRIDSIDPSRIHAGKSETITVRIQNNTSEARAVKLVGNVPAGCSLKPLQPDVLWFGNCKPTVPANGSFDAKFELSFSRGANLAGEITWTLKEDGRVKGWFSQPELDKKTQPIVPKVGMDQWKSKFTEELNEKVKTGDDGFQDIVEHLHRPCHYENGSVVKVDITTVDGTSDIWEDGYNISQIEARLHFNWARSAVYGMEMNISKGWTKLSMVYKVDAKSGEIGIETQTPSDIKTNAQLPMTRWEDWGDWAKVAAKVGGVIVAVVKVVGPYIAAAGAAGS